MSTRIKIKLFLTMGIFILLDAVLLFLSVLYNPLQADGTAGLCEMFLTNNLTYSVEVTVEPIGMIFNDQKDYSLVASATHVRAGQPITGVTVNIPDGQFQGNVVNHIATSTPSDITANRHIGFGKYRVTIGEWGYIDVDFSDSDYPGNYSSLGLDRDIFLDIRPSPLRVFWLSGITSGSEYQLVNGDLIQLWDQRRINGSNAIKTQIQSGFKVLAGMNMPLNGTDAVVTHIDPHKLFVNADVQGNVTITNDISVESSAALKLQTAGTQAKFNAGKQLNVNGTITVQGQSGNPVTFDRSGTSGTWSGIRFYSGSSGTITYATIDHATKGVYALSTDNVAITNCTIQNFSEQGIYASSSVSVQNSTIQSPAGGSHGVYLEGKYSSPIVTGNTIKDAPIGIERISSPGAATISGNTVMNCTSGIKAYLSAPEIYNNYVENNIYGIRLASSSSPSIHDNDVYSNSTGIYFEQSQPANVKWNNFGYSRGNTFANDDEGILVNYLQTGNTFLDGKWNNFYDGNATKDVSNPTSVTLKATGNYWYALTVTGPVDVSSPQTSHNNDAGPGGALGKITAADSKSTKPATELPTAFALDQNFPNPFNPGTVIGFKLPQAAIVTLTIYDLLRRRVRTLLSGVPYEAGFHNLNWDGTNDSGQTLASGIYIYRIEAKSDRLQKSYSESRKLLFTR